MDNILGWGVLQSSIVGFLGSIPQDIRDKLYESYGVGSSKELRIELVILYGSNPSEIKSQIEALGGTFDDLGYGYGIINIGAEALPDVNKIREINYIEAPKNLYLTFEQGNSASCIPDVASTYNLTGEGILIGFIDSGIDYTNSAFRDADGNTRIDYIYDLDNGGAVYDSAKINEALKSSNPSIIVPEADINGHGTHVAGIAAAGGNIPKKYYGAAPKSSIAMVKMTSASKSGNAQSTQLMRGINFLVEKANELNKPLSINISFSTNDGAHNGNSLLEQYIKTVSASQRVTISIAAGNEGGRAHHASGNLEVDTVSQFNIGPQEKMIIINLYKTLLADTSIKIVAPNSESTPEIKLNEGYTQGRIGNQQYFVYSTGPTPFNIDGENIIAIVSRGDAFISTGIWKINFTTSGQYGGSYDMWLPISEGLSESTKFLNPDINNTVGIPGTVSTIITVGSYNYINQTISPFSGRGNIELNPVKPDIASPGENIESIGLNGEYQTLSGTSMATPEVAGTAALLMEFGIIKGNDPYLYGQRVKYFLLKGAQRTRVDVTYPDNVWGYGTLCLKSAIDLWNEEKNS